MKIHRRLFSTLVVVCLSSVFASAAVYTVTSSNNDGAGSLREAIDSANSTGDDDLINFTIPGCGNGGCTIGFSGLPGTASLRILPAGTLTIANNPNASNIIISGNNLDRVFQLEKGANLTLSGMSVIAGNADNALISNIGGGGFYNGGGSLTLINSTIANCNSLGGGGGIRNIDGVVTLINATVRNNSGGNGSGGISSEGIVSISNSIFTENITTASSGSGIAIVTGSALITNSVFRGNIASTGGAIYVGGGAGSASLTMTGSTLEANVAATGGGFYNENGTVTITDSTIDSNTYNKEAGFGGGIYTNGGTTSLINSVVSRNRAGIIGGGIFNLGEIILINSTIVQNVSDSNNAGGIFNGSSVSIRNSIVSDNVADDSPDISSNSDFTSKGNNLIGNTSGSNVAWQPTDILDQSPRFGPRGNYGGPSQTFPLANNSPAINAGNNCVIALNGCGDGNPAIPADARGASRISNVDIGAFELNNTTNGGTFRAVTTPGRVTLPFSYQFTPESGAFSYSISAGTHPAGLSVSNALARSSRSMLVPAAGPYSLAGTPTMGGTFNYTITATDGTNSVSTDYSTTIAAAPTAADVDIGGRVLSGVKGFGISNAQVRLTDQNGRTRVARTNPFGAFSFTDVPAGTTYVINVSGKQYRFAPRFITAFEAIDDLTIFPEDSFSSGMSFNAYR